MWELWSLTPKVDHPSFWIIVAYKWHTLEFATFSPLLMQIRVPAKTRRRLFTRRHPVLLHLYRLLLHLHTESRALFRREKLWGLKTVAVMKVTVKSPCAVWGSWRSRMHFNSLNCPRAHCSVWQAPLTKNTSDGIKLWHKWTLCSHCTP